MNDGRETRLERGGAALLLLLLLAVILGTFRDYGISWDEGPQAIYGGLVVDFYRSGFTDTRCDDYPNTKYYGPLFEALADAAHRATGADLFETRHLLTALAGLAAIFAASRFAALTGASGAALLALIALAAMPRFWGHLFINSKDIPFAAAWAWAMVAVARFAAGRTSNRRAVMEIGLTIGTALAVRVGALFLFAFLAAGIVLGGGARGPAGRRRWLAALGAAAGAWGVMVLLWPSAERSPLLFPIEALASFVRFAPTYPVLFEGRTIVSDALPRTYLLRYLALTTPPATALLALVGLFASAARFGRERRGAAAAVHGLLLLWLLLPVAAFTLVRPNVYDGIRHFLFVLPAIAILAALGALFLAGRGPRRWRVAAGIAAGVLLALPVADMVELHPYEMTYFGPTARTMENGMPRYESDYWVTSYKEAMEWVNRASAGLEHPVVLVAANEFMDVTAAHYKSPRLTMLYGLDRLTDAADLPEGVDFFIATTRYGFDLYFPDAPVVHVIGRRGMPFTVIKARRSHGKR